MELYEQLAFKRATDGVHFVELLFKIMNSVLAMFHGADLPKNKKSPPNFFGGLEQAFKLY